MPSWNNNVTYILEDVNTDMYLCKLRENLNSVTYMKWFRIEMTALWVLSVRAIKRGLENYKSKKHHKKFRYQII